MSGIEGRASLKFPGDSQISRGKANFGSDFNAGDKKFQSKFFRNNPQIIVSGSSALIQEASIKKDSFDLQEFENILKPSSSRIRFQDNRKKFSPIRFGTYDRESSLSILSGKKDSRPLKRTSEFFVSKGIVTPGNVSTGSRDIRNLRISQKHDQSTIQACLSHNKNVPKFQTCLQKDQTGFPYPDPLQAPSIKFMQRISEISSLEAETKKWEQGVARLKKKKLNNLVGNNLVFFNYFRMPYP